MELNDRISILIQSAELAQKGGLLTLDEACAVKSIIDDLKEGKNLEQIQDLMAIAERGQKAGIYSFRDSHYIYLAIENIESVIQ